MQPTDVREAAQSAVELSKSFLNKQVDDRSTRLGQQLGSVAQDLRKAGRQLGGSDGGPLGGYLDRGAEAVAQFGQYLQEADSGRLIADLEEVARHRLWTFAGGALLLGFTTSRFLKTSSARRYRAADQSGASRTSSARRGAYGAIDAYRGTGSDDTPAYVDASYDGSSDVGRTSGKDRRDAT